MNGGDDMNEVTDTDLEARVTELEVRVDALVHILSRTALWDGDTRHELSMLDRSPLRRS
jgi:hypothetical protein